MMPTSHRKTSCHRFICYAQNCIHTRPWDPASWLHRRARCRAASVRRSQPSRQRRQTSWQRLTQEHRSTSCLAHAVLHVRSQCKVCAMPMCALDSCMRVLSFQPMHTQHARLCASLRASCILHARMCAEPSSMRGMKSLASFFGKK